MPWFHVNDTRNEIETRKKAWQNDHRPSITSPSELANNETMYKCKIE